MRLSVAPDSVGFVDYSPFVTAASSLVGAIVGASAVLGSQALQWRRERKADRDRMLQRAIEDVLVQVESIDLSLHLAVSLAKEFTSLSGQLNRLVRVSTAFDWRDLYSDLGTHLEELNRAAAQIWMSADQETVRRTNAVVLAAADIVTAHSAVRPATWRRLRRLLDGIELADPAAVERARARLCTARRSLVDHARREFDRPVLDLLGLQDDR